MKPGCVVVLDVGKTNAKLSLWTKDGRRLGAASHANGDVETDGYRALDVEGLQHWLGVALRDFARHERIDAIVPVAHGAAAAIIRNGQLVAPPMSYETDLAPDTSYDKARDAFELTGSPRLPLGLNLAAQLRRLDQLLPGAQHADATIVTYPQYWAWMLSGVAASEVTSLGCHTDLWRPYAAQFSDFARQAGWSRRFAPLRSASAVLGDIRADWAEATGLPTDCKIYCGAHDSNAAFYGARHHGELAGRDTTIISTGTWFVAMRAPAGGASGFGALSEARDTLINVGVEGDLIPSARFMGGREMEALIGSEASPLRAPDFTRDVAPLNIEEVVQSGAIILPTFAPGVGPFPNGQGRWIGPELEGAARRAAAGLYLALVADASLELIGSRDAIVAEGRFADDLSFLGALASLRPNCSLYASGAEDGVAYGALRLIDPGFVPPSRLEKVSALSVDLTAYAARWRALAGATQ